MDAPRPIVLTVFEPSGDALAARLVEELRRRDPGRPIFAMGGPRMEDAGAQLIELTTEHAKMGLGALSEARQVLRRAAVLRDWLKEHPVAALIPTDSPAANWSMCKTVRRAAPEAKILHLVGPQMWAWAPWRVGKLRRLSDHLMCLLPFEPDWFGSRGVASTFVGHPLFQDDAAIDREVKAADGKPLRSGSPKLALLPGSRPGEVQKNWPTMLGVYDAIRHRHPQLAVTVAAVDANRRGQLELMCRGGRAPRGMQVVVGASTSVLDWADAALVVSGTATLQAASRRTPAVAMYNTSPTAWKAAGRFLIRSRTFALPNVISEHLGHERVMPEFVPHFGAVEPLATALTPLLRDDAAREAQRVGFERIAEAFAPVRFREAAADVVQREIGDA